MTCSPMDYLFGVICGDGSISQEKRCVLIAMGHNESYSEELQMLISSLGFVVKRQNRRDGYHDLRINERGLAERMFHLKYPVWDISQVECQTCFIAGIIDTDGHIGTRKDKRVSVAQVKKENVDTISEMFTFAEITPFYRTSQVVHHPYYVPMEDDYAEPRSYILGLRKKSAIVKFASSVKLLNPEKESRLNEMLDWIKMPLLEVA